MKKLTKILPIISLALSLVLCFVVSFINSSGDIITQYHSSYFLVKDGWWAFLIFLPICLLSLALGLKQKDRIAIAISLVISLVLVIGSVAFAQQVKKYSFDKIYLSDIETKADIDFPKEACSKLSDARNLIGFRKYSDAIRAHYVPCKYCKPSSSYNVVVS
ncbi:MAG: hypothetical protein E7622_07865, partial [Ruminococcaceae bacterium]|nr:hypothetical protein [Oscillospiraceae bacterium]